jgi:hypothetical protein
MASAPQRFMCCFCGQTIEPKIPDVASILYTTCIDHPRNLQKDQELFCHTRCLQDRLYPKVKLYVLDLLSMEERPTVPPAGGGSPSAGE